MDQLSWRSAMILDAIPLDRWVTAIEIADNIGLTPHKIGGAIRSRLNGVYVERKRMSPSRTTYLYRRLPRVAINQEAEG